jgi:hypothetical protein
MALGHFLYKTTLPQDSLSKVIRSKEDAEVFMADLETVVRRSK